MGNIPAYAGKTGTPVFTTILVREHPRVCGENNLESIQQKSVRGTSPRMRGKRRGVVAPFSRKRNIPAYAGKTLLTTGPAHFPWEHPRVCGENSYFYSTSCPHQGTSPRMRGKHELTRLIN